MAKPGELASRVGRWPIKREIIGPPDCPLIHRWTLLNLGPRVGKLMVHRFLPNGDDRAVHDHPRPFVTIVVRGAYDDMEPCEACEGEGRWMGCALCAERSGLCECRSFWTFGMDRSSRWREFACGSCDGLGVVLRERMSAGVIRFRSASHRHRTKASPQGAWTIVLMGPLQQEWGFFQGGRKWPWRDFEKTFGYGMRCGDE